MESDLEVATARRGGGEGLVLGAASNVTERCRRQGCWAQEPGRAVGRLESHFGVPHPNPEVSAGESIEVHAWLRAEWVRKINALCKRRENWGGEVWSCLYTQMRLLETGWLEIGHDQFHHLGKGEAVCKNCTQLGGSVNVSACILCLL